MGTTSAKVISSALKKHGKEKSPRQNSATAEMRMELLVTPNTMERMTALTLLTIAAQGLKEHRIQQQHQKERVRRQGMTIKKMQQAILQLQVSVLPLLLSHFFYSFMLRFRIDN